MLAYERGAFSMSISVALMILTIGLILGIIIILAIATKDVKTSKRNKKGYGQA